MTCDPRVLRRPLLVGLIPAVWTVLLGLWGLSRQNSVWRDEAATWQVARRSTGDIVRMLEHVDVVHSLYYLCMHGLFAGFGPSTTVLRLPSVLAVAAAAACVALIGHRLAGAYVGLGAGLALGLLPAVQFYLQEGRPYALVAAGSAASTLLLVNALRGRGRKRTWAAYACAVLVCGWLNWLALLILPAHLITLLWSRAPRGVRVRWAVAAGAATAGVLPLALFSLDQSGQVSWVPPLTWHMMIGPAILLAIGGLGGLLGRRTGTGTAPGTGMGAAERTGVAGRTDRTGRADRTDLADRAGRPGSAGTVEPAGPAAGSPSVAAVGLPLLAVPQLGLIALSLVKPLFVDRYILFSLLGLALLIGALIGRAVDEVARRSRPAARCVLPVLVAVALVALLPQSLAKRSPASRVDDVLAAAERTRQLKHDGDGVLFIPAARRDTWLVTPDAFTGTRDIALAESPEESGTLKGVEASPARVRAAMLAQRRILLVTDAAGVARPTRGRRDRTKAEVLASHFTLVSDERIRGRRVAVYERLAPAGGG
ncbi:MULTISPECIES: glycosyltransferase family 39 protein [Streptomyces]|uniref:glycosyltransferase family 39 protein n=1 Tax=Streptomyces TaxID=1883 RepID=UPI00296F8342|nr:glycosyltransferase family 39 protein [Streptomyces californicus]MDW4901277.1 glycosyltransferase family 39 protein [Streptomyces californicus]